MSTTLKDAEQHEVLFEDREGRQIRGRFTGVFLAELRDGTGVYLTDDERVIVHDPIKLRYWEAENAEDDLRELLDDGDYIEVMSALGVEPVIDI